MWYSPLLLQLALLLGYNPNPSSPQQANDIPRSLARILSSLQCPTTSDPVIAEILTSFSPNDHVYEREPEMRELLRRINRGSSRLTGDDPFTNSAEHISEFSILLDALYLNTSPWPLFFNTTAWFVDKINSAQLMWAVGVVAAEKFGSPIPSMTEIFPQMFVDKEHVYRAAGIKGQTERGPGSPLDYYTHDPALHEFHTHWHIENPFWWNETKHGVIRDRRGEMFLYMHHQILLRYSAERLSNGLDETTAPLNLTVGAPIPDPYYPQVLNINYVEFPYRPASTPMRDTSSVTVAQLSTLYDRLSAGIDQLRFMGANGSDVPLAGDRGATILGDTAESSRAHSANFRYYGSLHNLVHVLLSQIVFLQPNQTRMTPGVQAHPETSMRDEVFYRIHSLIDSLYIKLKSASPAYTKKDLDFDGVSVKQVDIQTSSQPAASPPWPFQILNRPTPVLTTVMETHDVDISRAHRPCGPVQPHNPSATAPVRKLNHLPFKYTVVINSARSETTFGMVRVFIAPEVGFSGRRLSEDEVHSRAIEIDRLHVTIPKGDTTVTRSSTQSSVTRRPFPSIRAMYESPGDVPSRSCGFPNHLLIPKGSSQGLKFKMFFLVSEEPSIETAPDAQFPYCGSLHGKPYPDGRAMGYPFDRPGTRFYSRENIAGVGVVQHTVPFKNVKTVSVIIKHREE